MTDRDRAIEKVRKLRALAERPGTEAEGKAARARAAQVMLRHGLSEEDVAPAAERAPQPVHASPQWGVQIIFSPGKGVIFNTTSTTATGGVGWR